MMRSRDRPAFRLVKIIIVIALLSQYSCVCGLMFGLDLGEDLVDGLQASPEDSNGLALCLQGQCGDVIGILSGTSILMSPFISGANAQDDSTYDYTYKNHRIKFESEGSVTGQGFTNVRNRMENVGNDSISRSLHGSGSYSSENEANYYSIIASEVPEEITDDFGEEGDTLFSSFYESEFTTLKTRNLSAVYYITPFYLFGGTFLNFSSKWSDTTKAKSNENGVSLQESYRYATKMNKSNDIVLDSYDLDSKLDTDFRGAADIRYSSPENCFQDSYIGSYNLTQDLSYDEFISSTTGTGFANIDRKIMENGLQRSYAHGSGDLALEEHIGPEENYIAKSISITHKPTEFAVNPGIFLNQSSKWGEGVSSQSDNHVLISESFTGLQLLDKETEVTDMTNAETEANFTGSGEFVIAGDNFTSDEVYAGNYSILRKVAINQLPKYDKPHVTVTKQLYLDPVDCKMADYSITVINDGNWEVGPVFVRDTFPTSTTFQGSSEEPVELTTRIANWSIETLSPGESRNIQVKLRIDKDVDKLINRVRATAYVDKDNKQSRIYSNYNSTVLLDKNRCTPGELSITTRVDLDKERSGVIRYRSTVENLADYNVSVNFTSYFPEGASFLESSPKTKMVEEDNATWSFKLATGKKKTITHYVQYNGTGLVESIAKAYAISEDGQKNLTAEAAATILIPQPKTLSVDRITGDWLTEDLADTVLPVCGSDGGPCLLSPSDDVNLYRPPVRTVAAPGGYTDELPCC